MSGLQCGAGTSVPSCSHGTLHDGTVWQPMAAGTVLVCPTVSQQQLHPVIWCSAPTRSRLLAGCFFVDNARVQSVTCTSGGLNNMIVLVTGQQEIGSGSSGGLRACCSGKMIVIKA